ncbi:MAG: SRPBCC family protein [Agriterribacter sp.]
MPDIHHELLINASAETVYKALVTQEGLSAWWTPQTEAEPEINSIARFTFGSGYFKEMRIINLAPNNQVEWICIAGAEEWVGTTISFQLESADRETLLRSHPELTDQVQQQDGGYGTVLIFCHNDWKGYTPMYAECNYTWGRFLRSLKLFCETGKALPWPNQHKVD